VPVDRSLFTEEIRAWPGKLPFLCPVCRKGHYAFTGLVSHAQTAASREAGEYLSDPQDYDVARFASVAVCNNSSCRESAIVAGLKVVRVERDCGCPDCEERGWHYYEALLPEYISPAPMLIRLPSETPETIVELVHKACSEVWSSAENAMNSMRMALEVLTKDKGVSEFRPDGSFRPLDARLRDLLSKAAPTLDAALAVKWLGNSGSHVGEVTRDDALDCFDILEWLLPEIYDGERQSREKLVSAINLNRGVAPRTQVSV
jgi:hypothetical protein